MARKLAFVLVALALCQPALRAQSNVLPPAPDTDVDGAIPFSIRTDYLLWWVKRGPLAAPLVTLGDPTDAVPGGLGQQGTRVLFGGSGMNYNTFSGLSLQVDVPVADAFGINLGGFFLEQKSDGIRAASNPQGFPIIARPVNR